MRGKSGQGGSFGRKVKCRIKDIIKWKKKNDEAHYAHKDKLLATLVVGHHMMLHVKYLSSYPNTFWQEDFQSLPYIKTCDPLGGANYDPRPNF